MRAVQEPLFTRWYQYDTEGRVTREIRLPTGAITCTAAADLVLGWDGALGRHEEALLPMREAVDPSWGISVKTHLSHWFEWGSMIYPRFGIPKGPDDLDGALELHDKIVRAATLAAIEAGGVMNDHHGVGMRLAPYLERQLGATGVALLRRIKVGIDPDQILCPGKLAMQSEGGGG